MILFLPHLLRLSWTFKLFRLMRANFTGVEAPTGSNVHIAAKTPSLVRTFRCENAVKT